jgi:hypothetical protein
MNPSAVFGARRRVVVEPRAVPPHREILSFPFVDRSRVASCAATRGAGASMA